MSYFGLGNVYWSFFSVAVSGLFWTPRMFYPPEGLCRAEPERGPIVFTYIFLCRKGSQFDLFLLYIYIGNLFLIFILELVIGVFWPPKSFIPRRGELACSPSGSQFDSLSLLYLLRGFFFDFHFRAGNRPFLTPKIFYPPEVTNVVVPKGSQFDLFQFYIDVFLSP